MSIMFWIMIGFGIFVLISFVFVMLMANQLDEKRLKQNFKNKFRSKYHEIKED